jgi:hypothetical protein
MASTIADLLNAGAALPADGDPRQAGKLTREKEAEVLARRSAQAG